MGSSPMLRRVGLLALLPTCLLGLASQYPDLNALRSAYDGDLEILCVPSSNFFNQEPSGNPAEILNAIQHVRPGNNFQPDLTLFDRRGQPYKRFAPTTEPFEMEEDIRHLIEN